MAPALISGAAGSGTYTEDATPPSTLDLNGISFVGGSYVSAGDALFGLIAEANAPTVYAQGVPTADNIIGGAASEAFDGGAGNDMIAGGDGDDLAFWNIGGGLDSIDGGDGIDALLVTGDGTDEAFAVTAAGFGHGATEGAAMAGMELALIMGGDGNDTFTVSGNPALALVLDADVIGTNLGIADRLILDVGTDSFVDLGADLSVSLPGVVLNRDDPDEIGFFAFNFEDVTGGIGNDILLGSVAANLIEGGAGDDTLDGDLGNDTLDGGEGNDLLLGNFVDVTFDDNSDGDTLIGGDGDDTLYGFGGADSLDGGDGDDAIFGSNGEGALRIDPNFPDLTLAPAADEVADIEDILAGGTGNDSLYGQGGDDILQGDAGEDRLVGGDGVDTVSYILEEGANGVVVRLTLGFAIDGFGDTDTLDSIENAVGSQQYDDLDGDSQNNSLTGYGGDDVLSGGDGDDALVGGEGNDTIFGGDGFDLLVGGAGADNLGGGIGADFFRFDHLFELGEPGELGSFGAAADEDVITDFATGEDLLVLPSADLIGLTFGPLNAGHFVTAAIDAADFTYLGAFTNESTFVLNVTPWVTGTLATLFLDIEGDGIVDYRVATFGTGSTLITAGDIALF